MQPLCLALENYCKMGNTAPAQTTWWGQEISKQETTVISGGT